MFLQRRLRAVHAFPRVRRFRVHVRVIQRAATKLASPKATPVASAAALTALVVSVRNDRVADRIRWIFLLSMVLYISDSTRVGNLFVCIYDVI